MSLAVEPTQVNNARAMADMPSHAAASSQDDIRTPTEKTTGSGECTELPLFRFGLRQLFWFVALISALMTAIVWIDGPTALLLITAVLVIAAHVFGTALGSRLRSHADQALATADRQDSCCDGPRLPVTNQFRFLSLPKTARSPWHARGSTALPWLSRLVIGGILVGGSLGTIALVIKTGYRISPAGILVGGISLAVLGGWFAFLAGSFYGIVRHGVRDALAEQHKDEKCYGAGRPVAAGGSRSVSTDA